MKILNLINIFHMGILDDQWKITNFIDQIIVQVPTAPPGCPVIAYDSLARSPAARRRRWPNFVHQTPSEDEQSAVRRSTQTDLP